MIAIENRSTDPFYNLAFEEYVFTTVLEQDVLLLWRNAPCIVVGSGQNICRETSVPMLRRRGIPALRRISGGGAVYHDLGNINYTFLTRQEGPTDYGRSLAPILAALRAAGVPAQRSRVCDLAIGEKKISGSAQRSAGGRLLHHGTLLFDADLTALETFSVRGKSDCVRTKGTRSAICEVTNIRPHLAEDISVEEFQRRLMDQLVPSAGDRIRLTEEQEEEVLRLRDEKYRGWMWTWGRTPAFTYERQGEFAGAPFSAAYRCRRGVLSDVSVTCPLLDSRAAKALFSGARLDPEGLAGSCRDLAGERAEELFSLLL